MVCCMVCVCTNGAPLLSLRAMQIQESQLTRSRWTRWLNILLAVIFGLVLPFICWGAEATPGHPHARAHFVFLAPMHRVGPAWPTVTNAQELLRATAEDLARGVHDLCATAPRGGEAASTTASQSTPLMLAIALLLLAVVRWLTTLLLRNDAGFFLRMTAFLPRFPLFDVDTPPPRLHVSFY